MGQKHGQNGNGTNPLAFDVDRTVDVELVHPVTGDVIRGPDGRVATITIVGPDSAEAREHERKATARRLERVYKRGRMAKPDPDEGMRETAEYLAALTRGWHIPALNGAGGEYAFTREHAVEMYSDRRTAWVRRQVEKALDDAAAFFGS